MTGVLLITGGASGIGAETAKLAASRGFRVGVNYRTRTAQAEAGVGALRQAGCEAVAIQADMARETDIVRMFEETARALGPVTHLVNSAGIGGGGRSVDALDAVSLAELMAVNVTGVMLCCREAARRMSRRRGGNGGAIVNVSSMAATTGGRPGNAHYAASKAAVDAFTKGFAKEVAQEGIRVNAIRPGMILTEMTEDRLRDPAFRADIEETIPMGRIGTAREIASAILWLLSEESSFITGAMIDAAGGGFNIGKAKA